MLKNTNKFAYVCNATTQSFPGPFPGVFMGTEFNMKSGYVGVVVVRKFPWCSTNVSSDALPSRTCSSIVALTPSVPSDVTWYEHSPSPWCSRNSAARSSASIWKDIEVVVLYLLSQQNHFSFFKNETKQNKTKLNNN